MRRKANPILMGIIILSGLLLAACGSASQKVDSDPKVDTAQQQQEVEESIPAGNVEVTEGETAPTPVPPELVPEEVKPTPRQELSASDPSTVVLAFGEPQVVEFFAFW